MQRLSITSSRNSISQSQSKNLLKMFQSEEFTPNEVIKYFISTFDEPGPHQFLTNKLLSMPEKFVEYYIPQFCFSYMQAKNYSLSMDGFLEDLCKRSISNYLKIIWCLHAYADTDRDTPRFEKTERRLEAAMVNGEMKLKQLDLLIGQESVEFNIKFQKMFQEKEHRFNYVSLVARFIIQMVCISLSLKQIIPEQRKPSLLHQIKLGNKSIRKHRLIHQELEYYWGILLPFERTGDKDDASNLMVRIVETDFACFNTKTRVPYKIIIETVNQKEIKSKNSSTQSYKPSNDAPASDSDSFMSDEPPQTMEYLMKDLTRMKQEDVSFDLLTQYQQGEASQRSSSRSQSMVIINQRRSSWSNSTNIQKTESTRNSSDDFLGRRKNQELNQTSPSHKEKKPQLLSSIEKHYDNELLSLSRGLRSQPKIHKLDGPWGEDWDNKVMRIKEGSPFKDFESYKVRAIIVKGGDDLRQELLAMQVIQKIDEIFRSAYLNLYLRPYEIIITSENSGILEFCPNTLAMDGLKKSIGKQKTLKQFYFEHFTNDVFKAQQNFVESLAAYSLVTYLLQIKDRHNGNILIDNQGHLIHIDFGFMLSNSPGNMNFESAPFKFTKEYLDLMNGPKSQLFEYYKVLMVRGFLEIRKQTQAIVQLVEMMSSKSNFPCFKNFQLNTFRERFKENDSPQQCEDHVLDLIRLSINNWRTIQYDKYQRLTNGIEP